MKKIFCLIIFLLIFIPINYDFSFAENSQFYYAKIQNEGYFYSSANSEDKLFQIPTSYFVLLTGEENSEFYRAEYKNKSGFVKKSEVTPMSGTPTSPYPNASFRIFAKEGLGLYSSPSSNSSLLSTIPYLCDSVEFYGYMTGEEDIPNKSTQWIYCLLNKEFGYVYSVFCDSLPTIPKNEESFDVLTPSFSVNTLSQSSPSTIWIIIGVGLPSLVVLFLLIKPSFNKTSILSRKTPRPHKRDYFEFDDSSLN